ncbi:hypothetical protein B0E43_11635 [Algoriphagus sp. A40]|nr:hypothetical protein B0E43_11635 [Algoriphagus sp. A40]
MKNTFGIDWGIQYKSPLQGSGSPEYSIHYPKWNLGLLQDAPSALLGNVQKLKQPLSLKIMPSAHHVIAQNSILGFRMKSLFSRVPTARSVIQIDINL